MSFKAFCWAFEVAEVPNGDYQHVLLTLANITPGREVRASVTYIARQCKRSPRKVRVALQWLEGAGIITITERPGFVDLIRLSIPVNFQVSMPDDEDNLEDREKGERGRPRKTPAHPEKTPTQESGKPLANPLPPCADEPLEPNKKNLEGSNEPIAQAREVALIPDEIEIDIIGDGFAIWWKTYPKRQGRKPAESAFRVAVRKLKPMGTISVRLDFLISQAQALADNLGSEVHFAPKPERWLRQESWTDELRPRNGQCAVADPGLARNGQRNAALFEGARSALERFERERRSDPFAGR